MSQVASLGGGSVDRLAATTHAWASIDWQRSTESATLPLAHYPQLVEAPVSESVKRDLARLFACFTCELFIHFEGYLIDYLRRYPERIPLLPREAIAGFVHEEELHRDAFRKLLPKLRPDLYPTEQPRFLARRPSEDWVLHRLPPVSFFLLAMFFEEITLFVPEVIARSDPGESAELVREVMDLHARDERAHVRLDERVLRHLSERQGRIRTAAQVLLTLPALLFLDRQVSRGFRGLLLQAVSDRELSAEARRWLARRKPTESDRLGTESFAGKVEQLELPGGRLLAAALRKTAG